MFLARLLAWLRNRGTRRRLERGSLADRGEALAARHLKNAGLTIVARNWRCKVGEIDVIARDGAAVVFVEVKTRVGDDRPEEAVNREKRRRLLRAARLYLRRFEDEPQWRFDVVAVVWADEPIVRHHRNAFTPDDV